MFRDEYTNFSFNELESENFKVWITNKNDLKRNMSPNFSDKFNTPTGSQIRYHEGTTIDKQDFKLSCAAVDVTLNEWRAITEWLSPLKQGKLRFEWNDKYYYMVKVSKAPSGTMFMKGRIDDIMGQLYIITFDLEFTTVHDWAALGNYAEQNSIKEIDSSVYNNEYYMPSIIMRDKYYYRAKLEEQTMYPSADLVMVSSNQSYDFTLLTVGTFDGAIKTISSGKTPLPEQIIFTAGCVPVVQCWNFKENKYNDSFIICSEDIEAIKDIDISVANDTSQIIYKASYNEDKEIVLTLQLKGVVEEYEGRFILAGIVYSGDNGFKEPIPSLEFDLSSIPNTLYRGETYTIKAIVTNSYKPIKWESNAPIIIKDNECSISIPINFAADDVNLTATIVDPLGTVSQSFDRSIESPKIVIESVSTTIGIEESTVLTASLHGLDNVGFEWVVQGEGVTLDSYDSLRTVVTGRWAAENIKIFATGRSADNTEIKSNEIIMRVKASSIELQGSETALKQGAEEPYRFLIDIIGEIDKGTIFYSKQVFIDENKTTGIDIEVPTNIYDLDNGSGDKELLIWVPKDLTDTFGNKINQIFLEYTVTRSFEDGRLDQSSTQTYKIIRGVEIQNVPTSQYIKKDPLGGYYLTTVEVEDCLALNNFNDGQDYLFAWESSDASVMEIAKVTDFTNLTLNYYKPGKVTLSCTISRDSNAVDTASIDINVVFQKTIDWSSDEIILYTKNEKTEFGHYSVDNIISDIFNNNNNYVVRAALQENGFYEIAYYEEHYEEANSDVLAVQVDLSDFKELQETSVRSIVEKGLSADVVVRKARVLIEGAPTNVVKYYIPTDNWNEDVEEEIHLSVLNGLYKIASSSSALMNAGKVSNNHDIVSIEGDFFTPLDPYYFVYKDAGREIFHEISNASCNNNVVSINETIEATVAVSFAHWCKLDNALIQLHYEPDQLYYNGEWLRIQGAFPLNYTVTNYPSDSCSMWSNVLTIDITSEVNFSGKVILYTRKPYHKINELPVKEKTNRMMFGMRRTTAAQNETGTTIDPYLGNLPTNSSPLLRVVNAINETVGFVYSNTNKQVYYRHYFNNGNTYWDDSIGDLSYYEFKSHPSYSLISHSASSTHTLILKSNSNTVICNTGVFNMYPMFFIKGGCKISDSINTYYSFLTNTNMTNLFVTINSRTSTMLHNGYAIDGSYNMLGVPLFKDIHNENQLFIPSGKPELLKAIFVSDEEVQYPDLNGTPLNTGRRIAKFLINSKPMYGRREKFAVHLFNTEFHNTMSNIFNNNKYEEFDYYNSLKNGHYKLLDSPYIQYNKTNKGWEMTITYRAYDKGDGEQIYDFCRHSYESEYNNVDTIEEITDKQTAIYISLCDYKELEIRSEGEDYSVGCQARGVI